MSLRPLARAASTKAAWSVASLPPPGAWGHAVAALSDASGCSRVRQAHAVAGACSCRRVQLQMLPGAEERWRRK